MQTKLTLRLDDMVIACAKQYAAEHSKSLSQMVQEYFELLLREDAGSPKALPPLTLKLKGSLKGHKVSKKDYHNYLEKKYL